MLKAAASRHGGVASPMMGDHLVRCHVVVEEMEADEEASIVTRGLDVLQPYQSASHSWRMDAKA